MSWVVTTVWHHKNICEGYKGSALIEAEQAIGKAIINAARAFIWIRF